MITNLVFNNLLNEVSGTYIDSPRHMMADFIMDMYLFGDDEPGIVFHNQQYYTTDGDPKLLQPQFEKRLCAALREAIQEREEYQYMLRDYRIQEYDYTDHYE